MFRCSLLLVLIGWTLVGTVKISFAAPGGLDPTFGDGGKIVASFGGTNNRIFSTAIQIDGKIVVAGQTVRAGNGQDIAVARYNANGTPDTTFGVGGAVITPIGNFNEIAYSLAIQPDGKIVVAGFAQSLQNESDFAVVRYNPDGTLDTSFDGDGKVTTSFGRSFESAYSLNLQADGKILVAGYSGNFGPTDHDFALVRYNADGSLDNTFDGDGKVLTDIGNSPDDVARASVIQSDGKIVVGGASNRRPAVVRYNSNGALDTSFGNNGIVITPISAPYEISLFSAIALQPDGKIVGSGTAQQFGVTSVIFAIRYDPNGSLDSSFDDDGIVITARGGQDFAESMVIQRNGKIVVAGSSFTASSFTSDFAAVRYNPNGSLDSSFGGGIVITPVGSGTSAAQSAAIQPDGKIVLAGSARTSFALVRYQGDVVSPNQPLFDFDGDRKTDVGVFRPSDGSWWYVRSSDNAFRVFSFGSSTDIITPGDFTGDGKADIAVFRSSTGEWFVQRSEDNSYFSFPFGAAGDVPAPADYGGDGKTDAAVFRPSSGTWYILNSGGSGTSIVQFGSSEDKPVPADFDGDGKADIAIFRPPDGSWWYLRSSDSQFRVFRFGVGTDKPVQGDYTGDGKADLAVFRPSTGEWFVQRSEDNSYFSFVWGANGDMAVPGDYDGDGKFDTSVFRPSNSTWYLNQTSAGVGIVTFGSAGDRPVPNAFVP